MSAKPTKKSFSLKCLIDKEILIVPEVFGDFAESSTGIHL